MENKQHCELIKLIQKKIEKNSDFICEQWKNPIGTKTRHFILDDFLPNNIAMSIYNSFPKSGEGFRSTKTFREKKKTSAELSSHDSILASITYAIQDHIIVDKIAELTDFENLSPDPNLYAGGLSMMFKGDFLNPHIDNSHDSERNKFRRLNLLYYVTPNWVVENGGNLELWDDSRQIPKTLTAAFNRLIVMETNKTSWHSVSPVLVNNQRCCVSNYFFSDKSPDGSEYFHVTSFSGRPDEHVKRIYGILDNGLRNIFSSIFKIGRGKRQMNKYDKKL
jgi:Rps23 Pro-64 3,4-dihydroxylase Tpa1-like proline 4-hydroxylase